MGINTLLSLFKNLTPRADKHPAAASFVELPPRPIIIFLTPLPRASRIISPVPYVVVLEGSFLSPTRGRPAADAISMTAVFPLSMSP